MIQKTSTVSGMNAGRRGSWRATRLLRRPAPWRPLGDGEKTLGAESAKGASSHPCHVRCAAQGDGRRVPVVAGRTSLLPRDRWGKRKNPEARGLRGMCSLLDGGTAVFHGAEPLGGA